MRPCIGNDNLTRRTIYQEMCRNTAHSVHIAYILADKHILPLRTVLYNIKPRGAVIID